MAATVSGRLVVFDTLPLDGRNPLEWSPLGFNHGDTETTLADWLRLPWPASREVLLPGFHTAAETSLYHDEGSSAPDGNELFLSTMALVGAAPERSSSPAGELAVPRCRMKFESSYKSCHSRRQPKPGSGVCCCVCEIRSIRAAKAA